MTSDLIQDLAQYRKYRNKNVMSAASSLVHLYRHIDPTMLRRRDRVGCMSMTVADLVSSKTSSKTSFLQGRPTVAAQDLKLAGFGEVKSANYVEGAEALPSDEEGTVQGLL
jgi:protein SDA1